MKGLFAAVVTMIAVAAVTLPALFVQEAASGIIAGTAVAVMGGFIIAAIDRNGRQSGSDEEDE